MSEFDISEYVLTAVINYGAPAFGLALFLGALGVPVPGTLLVLSMGAFVRQEVLNGGQALFLGLLGVVIGDSLSYSLGRFAQVWITEKFAHSETWQLAQKTFNERGGIAIFLTRCLFTPIAIPTNLIAGGSRYPYPRFLGYDTLGELTWLLVYGGIGYALGSQWEIISDFISDFSGFLVGFALVGLGIYLWRTKE